MTITESNLQPDTPEARTYNRTRRWLEIGDLVDQFRFSHCSSGHRLDQDTQRSGDAAWVAITMPWTCFFM